MVSVRMVKLSNARKNYDYTGELNGFIFEGSCTYSAEKLIEANGTVYVLDKNPEVEGDTKNIGNFNYSDFLPEKVNYSFYIEPEYQKEFILVLIPFVSELADELQK